MGINTMGLAPVSAVEAPREKTAATTVSMIALQLDTLITDVVKANEQEAAHTISVLERMGLSTATTFVMPLIEILRRPTESPLRQLNIFQVQALHCPKSQQQRIVLDECEQALTEGSLSLDRVTTGIVKSMLTRYAAKRDAANMRTIAPAASSKSDYQIKNFELETKIELLERALTIAATRAGMTSVDYVASLLAEGVA